MFNGAQFRRTIIVSAISLGVGSAALAAESQSSSMAGGMAGSSAAVGSTSASGGPMGGESSTMSATNSASTSSTQRGSSAAAENSAMQTPMPQNTSYLGAKNPSGGAGNSNPTRGEAGNLVGRQPAGQEGGMIQNSVKPAPDNQQNGSVRNNNPLSQNGAASINSRQDNGSGITVGDPNGTHTSDVKASTQPKAPKAKVQYWNQRRVNRSH